MSGAMKARVLQAMFIGSLISLSAAAAARSAIAAPQSSVTSGKPTHVLFMCPHGAAKSVLASAYFRQLAKERGLNVRVDAAGTEPDPAVSPAVAAHLKKNGYELPIAKPRAATSADLDSADVVISLGCDANALSGARGTVLRWDDVPGPGEDFTRADEAIRRHVAELVDELVRRSKQ